MAQVLGDERRIVARLQMPDRESVATLVRRVPLGDRHILRPERRARLAEELACVVLAESEQQAQRVHVGGVHVRQNHRPELRIDHRLSIAIHVLRAVREYDALVGVQDVNRPHGADRRQLEAATFRERRECLHACVGHRVHEPQYVLDARDVGLLALHALGLAHGVHEARRHEPRLGQIGKNSGEYFVMAPAIRVAPGQRLEHALDVHRVRDDRPHRRPDTALLIEREERFRPPRILPHRLATVALGDRLAPLGHRRRQVHVVEPRAELV
ncbi:MAG TPA: hypothetical protein VFW04_02605 [Gemmatimonadaceae bacterium]|nr:hypothetical protein [Gemmatimonadaceae bacterium]